MKQVYGFNTAEDDPVLIKEGIFTIDGYHFGDRLLEGVLFDVTIKDERVVAIKVQDDCCEEERLVKLNMEYWYQEAREYAEHIIKEGDEVMLPPELEAKYQVQYAFVGFKNQFTC